MTATHDVMMLILWFSSLVFTACAMLAIIWFIDKRVHSKSEEKLTEFNAFVNFLSPDNYGNKKHVRLGAEIYIALAMEHPGKIIQLHTDLFPIELLQRALLRKVMETPISDKFHIDETFIYFNLREEPSGQEKDGALRQGDNSSVAKNIPTGA